MVVRKLAPNANGKMKIVRQGCVWPGQSTYTFHLILTHKHTHTVSCGRKVMQRGERNKLCAVIKKPPGIKPRGHQSHSSKKKNKLSNHTQKKKGKRKRRGVFQWWIIKKHQSMKPMGSCIGNLQESWQVFYRPSAFLPLIQNRSNTGLSLETRTTDRYFSLKKLSLRGLIIPL